MSKIEVNTVEPQCGTTLTLGACGDTVALGSGTSQTGFGRTGTVDWQTGSVKTGDFTGATGKGYFVNTTSGTVTATLPASPTAGDIVGLKDYALTFDTNSMFIGRNSEPINGATGTTLEISTEGATIMLVYVDATKGWIPTQDDASALLPVSPTYVVATGGSPCSGAIVDTNYKVHTFTGPGTLCVSCAGNASGSNSVAYMVVAGGGGGGQGAGGGGGAGGFREGKPTSAPNTASPIVATGSDTGFCGIPVTATGFPIVVGGGGAGAPAGPVRGTNGVDSSFSTITSAGGGGGGSAAVPVYPGAAGGSGGGGRANQSACGGAGNTPSVTPAQGFAGGSSAASPYAGCGAGGGGGATAVGGDAPNPVPGQGGAGGAGAATCISGTPTTYAGGGGGPANNPGTGGPGGAGGGGDGSDYPGATSTAGTVNTGGGGGGGYPTSGNAGGSGIVIIRYKFQ